MTNTKLLKEKIEQSGLKKSYIAKALGMTRSTLRAYLEGRMEFRVSHTNILCALLKIDVEQREAIFFGQDGALKATKRDQ